MILLACSLDEVKRNPGIGFVGVAGLVFPDALRFSGLHFKDPSACSLDEVKRNPGIGFVEWRGCVPGCAALVRATFSRTAFS